MWKKNMPGFKQGSDLFSEPLQRCARILQPRLSTLTFTVNLDGFDRFLCRFAAPATSLNTPVTGMHPLSKRNLPPQPRETFKKKKKNGITITISSAQSSQLLCKRLILIFCHNI